MADDNREYPERLAARVPADFPKLVAAAASRTYTSVGSYIRLAVAERLAKDGFTVETVPPSAMSTRSRVRP